MVSGVSFFNDMLDDTTTDVTATVDSGSGVDSSTASVSVGTSDQPAQTTASAGVTGQSSAGEQQPEQDEADGRSHFLPTEELEANPDRIAKALLRVQQSHQRLWDKHRPLETLKDYQPLVERGTPDTIQQRLDRYDSLISPVIDPQTQQRVVDPQTGFEAFTTRPFIEAMQAEQAGFAEQLLFDVLSLEHTLPTGQKTRMWERMFQESFGLDPNRLEDYRNIDALTAQVSGQNLTEQLAQIPPEYHDLFKSLPPKVRDDFLQRDEEVRNWELKDRLAAFNVKQQQEATHRQQAEAQQRYQQELRASIEREQDADIEQQFGEGLSAIMDDIASKVTFSSDPKQDASQKAILSLALHSLRDPANHAHMKPYLEALGVQLDAAFAESLAGFTQSRRSFKALDLTGRKAQAQSELAKARAPRAQVMLKAGQLALTMAQALGGEMKAKAESRNGQLQEAGQIRPTVNGEAPGSSTNLVDMARAAGVNLNDGKAVNAFIIQQLAAQPSR